ncbi:putative transcriptional regulator [Dysgonomonadaceae bacterium PH5-43]|nr:putative transcriptional regulator [Dysgonomonadaceae bacterium PH5-43]
MSNLSNSLKSLVSQEMITRAAKTVNEDKSKISKAVSLIIPSLLGVLMKKKGHSPQVENILHEAGNLNILSELENICDENPTEEQRKIADDSLQHILGDKAASFTDAIAEEVGISRVATNRLIYMIAPIVIGFIGNKLVRENWTKAQLFEELEKEKSNLQASIPSALTKAFDLDSVLNTIPKKVINKKTNGWVTWLIIIIAVLLAFLCWRACKNENTKIISNEVVETVISTPNLLWFS